MTLADVSSDTWWAWHEDFLIEGRNTPGHHRDGRLELLAADGTPSLRIELRGLGLVRITTPPVSAGDGELAVLRAELYCEATSLTPPM